MHLRVVTFVLVVLFGSAHAAFGAERFPGADWERLPPEASGWSAPKLEKARAWSRQIGSLAVMVVQHGAVVAEWGDIAAKNELASMRKSLLSALIGKAVARHEIDITQTIGALGIDDVSPPLSDEEKMATVRDLLQERSGVYHPALYEAPDMVAARPPPHSHPPGSFFHYGNWDPNTLGTIYEHAVHDSIFAKFYREIAQPIGMQDFVPTDGEYVTGAASVHAAYPFKMSVRDLARFALLYLRHGRWQDQEIIPAGWVEESTKQHSSSLNGPGYGYLWWTAPLSNDLRPGVDLPDGSFFALGAGGQYALVIPAYDMVVVHIAPHVDRGVDRRHISRLLWLLFDAAGLRDFGPDQGIEAAEGTKPDGAALSQMLTGKTVVYGEANAAGPFRMRLDGDGSAALLKGPGAAEVDKGRWEIRDGRLCRTWEHLEPRQACFAAVVQGTQIKLFDRLGVKVFDARIADE